LGALFATVLYFRENKRKRFEQNWIFTLAGLRFVGITLLSFLLLRPILENVRQTIEKPIVVVLQDNSSSVQPDLIDRSSYLEPLQNQMNALGEDVEVIYYLKPLSKPPRASVEEISLLSY
jgi:predicted AAA+ superfamily ATPase